MRQPRRRPALPPLPPPPPALTSLAVPPSPILTAQTENCNAGMTTPEKIPFSASSTCRRSPHLYRVSPRTHSPDYSFRVTPTAAGSSAALAAAERLDRGVSRLNCRIL